MSSFRKHTLTVKRRSSGDYDAAGFFKVSGPDTEFTITASIQPITGSEMLLLPENRRELETKKIFTSTELYGIEKGNGINADIVIIDGDEFEVVRVYPWKNNVINHYKIFVAKRTTNDNVPPESS
jgi:hypothetical protein